MARKIPATAAKAAPRNGGSGARSLSRDDALKDLFARAARNAEGACQLRSDPLADAESARGIVEATRQHAAELARRGLSPGYAEAALSLAQQIEDRLQALPAAAVTARGRSVEQVELLADAVATAQAVREAILRVTRGVDGRHVARDFGLGEPFSARQPGHVLRALRRILDAARRHQAVAADAGLLPEDLEAIGDLANDLEAVAGNGGRGSDEQALLSEAQGALRAYFDLFAAKTSVALSADREERARVLALLPRADDRRHLRRAAEREM